MDDTYLSGKTTEEWAGQYANIPNFGNPDDQQGEYAEYSQVAYANDQQEVDAHRALYANIPASWPGSEYDATIPTADGNGYGDMSAAEQYSPNHLTGRDHSPDQYVAFDPEALRAQRPERHVTWGENEEVTFDTDDRPADLYVNLADRRQGYYEDELEALL